MCEPTTLLAISLALTAASGAASYDQGRSNANKQTDALNKQADLQANDLARARDQQSEAAAQQMNESARKAFHDTSLFDAVAGEYGGGNTADRTRTIGEIQQGEQLATIAGNARTAQSETSFQQLATLSQANSRMASIQRPSLFGTALQIGGAAVSAYGNYKAQTRVPGTGAVAANDNWDLSHTTRGSGD